MNITASQIAQEHDEALASLTVGQRQALARLRDARQRTHFNGRFVDENLKALFEAEAASRSQAQDEAMFEAARLAAAAPAEADRRQVATLLYEGLPVAA